MSFAIVLLNLRAVKSDIEVDGFMREILLESRAPRAGVRSLCRFDNACINLRVPGNLDWLMLTRP